MPTFKEILDTRFKGVLKRSRHFERENEACALELLSVRKGIGFTDQPSEVRCFDFRMINDMEVPDDLRTTYMLRMLEAYEDSLDWDEEKRRKVVQKILISTVNQLAVKLNWLTEEARTQCKAANTLDEALSAAYASEITLGVDLVYIDTAAESAAIVARCVANSCSSVDCCVDIFIKACEIWLEAAKEG